jgi:hypothetical protein
VGFDPLLCTQCEADLPRAAVNQDRLVTCEVCGHQSIAYVFPAYYTAEVAGERAPSRRGDQSSCFFHPGKVAQTACDGCGRFLCSVCDIVVGAHHLCPICVQNQAVPGSASKLETERVRHDQITLALAVVAPFVMFPVVPLTAPYAVYRGIRYFRNPGSLVSHSKWPTILALFFAFLQIAGMVAIVVAVLR